MFEQNYGSINDLIQFICSTESFCLRFEMNVLIVFLLMRVALAHCLCSLPYDEEFERWKSLFNKTFDCEYDETSRFENFVRNKERIDDHNRKFNRVCNVTYKLGLWERSDLSEIEVNEMYNGLFIDSNDSDTDALDERTIFLGSIQIQTANVTNFSWASKGALSGVLDQGNCACCYALTAAAAIEAQIFLRTQNLTTLSAQQIIDCSFDSGNNGCNFGNTWSALDYVKQNGITTDEQYQFEAAETGTCSYNESMKAVTVPRVRYQRISSNNFLRVILVPSINETLTISFAPRISCFPTALLLLA